MRVTKTYWLGFLALLAGAASYGTFGIWIRILSRELDPFEQIVFRNIIGFVLIALILLVKKKSLDLRKISRVKLLIYSISFPLGVVCFTLSVLEGKIAVSVFALYVGSILTSLPIGLLFFKESFDVRKALSLVLALLGLAFFSWPLSEGISAGFILGLLSGVFDAVSNSFRKFFSGRMDRFILTGIQMAGGVFVATVFLLIQRGSFSTFLNLSPVSWLVGFVFGLFLVGVNYLLLFGFSHFDLNLGSIILSSELFFATILSLLVFGEKPTGWEFFGGILILLAVVAANLNYRLFRRPS